MWNGTTSLIGVGISLTTGNFTSLYTGYGLSIGTLTSYGTGFSTWLSGFDVFISKSSQAMNVRARLNNGQNTHSVWNFLDHFIWFWNWHRHMHWIRFVNFHWEGLWHMYGHFNWDLERMYWLSWEISFFNNNKHFSKENLLFPISIKFLTRWKEILPSSQRKLGMVFHGSPRMALERELNKKILLNLNLKCFVIASNLSLAHICEMRMTWFMNWTKMKSFLGGIYCEM